LISAELIDLDFDATDVNSAITRAGELLADYGACNHEYIAAMVSREEKHQTSFPPGFALPHGELDDLRLIHLSALSFVRLKAPIRWGEIDVAVVIGLAAKPGENREILGKVADVMQSEESWAKLLACKARDKVLELLL
jgi:PTS system ascorbate-specific IIA component